MKRLSMLLCLCLALASLCGLTGCSKPRINLAVASQPNVNPDFSGRPSPVIVKMYELRQDVAFKQADFQPLFETPIQVLGADLIAADELVFIPGEARRVTYEPNSSTRYIGIVAGFRQMERGVWRTIKPVDSESKNWVALELNDTSILVVPDKDAEDWEPTEAVRKYQQQSRQPAGVAQPQKPKPAPAPSAPSRPAGSKEDVSVIRGNAPLPGAEPQTPSPAPSGAPLPSMRTAQ